MFALLQDQHKSQLEVMDAANKVTIDAMIGCMNTMLGGSGAKRSKRDKTIHYLPPMPPPKRPTKRTKRKKKLCPHCNMFVCHKPGRCYEVKANEDKRLIGWKSVKETSA